MGFLISGLVAIRQYYRYLNCWRLMSSRMQENIFFIYVIRLFTNEWNYDIWFFFHQTASTFTFLNVVVSALLSLAAAAVIFREQSSFYLNRGLSIGVCAFKGCQENVISKLQRWMRRLIISFWILNRFLRKGILH